MNKLFIDNNKNKIPVAELGIVLNKEQVILGNLERDLILRTAGNVKVQVGNKFFDFPLTINSDNTESVLSNVTIFSTIADFNASPYPGDGKLIFVSETSAFYISFNGGYIQLNKVIDDSDKTNKIYLSYIDNQELSGENKYTVLLNTGYLIDTIEDIIDFSLDDVYEGQIILSIEDGKHYQLIDVNNPNDLNSWTELYLSLKGGTVAGKIILDAPENSWLQLKKPYPFDNLSQSETKFNGISLGTDFTNGGAIWYNEKDIYFSSQASGGSIRFLTKNASGSTATPLIIGGTSVGIGLINYNYNFNVAGSANFDKNVVIGNKLSSKTFISGIDGEGFALYRDDSDKWKLEVDSLLVRDQEEDDPQVSKADTYVTKAVDGSLILNFSITISELNFKESFGIFINVTKAGLYSGSDIVPLKDKSTYVNAIRSNIGDLDEETLTPTYQLTNLSYGIGDRTSGGSLVGYSLTPQPIGTHTYDGTAFVEAPGSDLVHLFDVNVYSIDIKGGLSGISLGDLFYYRYWNENKTVLKTNYVEVVRIEDEEAYIYVYGDDELEVGSKLIKIGNKTDREAFIQLNGADKDNPFIDLNTGIETFNDLVDNLHYTTKFEETYTQFAQDKVRVRIGSLRQIEDEDLGIEKDNDIFGIYSDNAYLKGNFVGHKLILGTQLDFKNDILKIVDLETLKNRTITGVGALEGGGKLFDGNIQIKHKLKTWTNKATLGNGTVISNLTVDNYGHLTDWTTRVLTTAHIIEDGPLYFTRDRVKEFGDLYYLRLDSPTQQVVLGDVEFSQPVKGVKGTEPNEFIILDQLTSLPGNYTSNVIASGAQDGENLLYNMPHEFILRSTQLYVNGVRQHLGDDYIELDSTTIEFVEYAPIPTDNLTIDYRKA